MIRGMEAQVLSLAAMARRLKLPRQWLKAEATAGRIPCLPAGRQMLFNVDAVERALAERAAINHVGQNAPAELAKGADRGG